MWKEENDKLKRTFEFDNFIEAFGFMTKVAFLAEKLDTTQIGRMYIIRWRLNSPRTMREIK